MCVCVCEGVSVRVSEFVSVCVSEFASGCLYVGVGVFVFVCVCVSVRAVTFKGPQLKTTAVKKQINRKPHSFPIGCHKFD